MFREFLKQDQIKVPESEGCVYFQDETYLPGKADGVLLPEDHSQVEQILKTIHKNNQEKKNKLTVTVRGLGSGLSAGAVPEGGIVLSLERMNKILDLDKNQNLLTVEAGITPVEIDHFLKSYNLLYPPDPSSFTVSSVGGNIATNAAGPRSFRYGPTRNHIASIRVIWANGESDWVGSSVRKSVVGMDLKNLMIGSEGRLGIISQAKLKLISRPPYNMLFMVGFSDYKDAVGSVLNLVSMNLEISALEFIDEHSIHIVRDLWPSVMRDKKAAVLIEMEGNEELLYNQLGKLTEIFDESQIFAARDERSARNIWEARREISVEFRKKYRFKIGEDITLPVYKIPESLPEIYNIGKTHGFFTVIWGHIGDGNLHVNFLFNEEEKYNMVKRSMESLANFVMDQMGSISGEHGLGRLKRFMQSKEQSSRLIDFQEKIKRIFDPENILNPNIILDIDYSHDNRKYK